jgi:cell shape-determining protein MreC
VSGGSTEQALRQELRNMVKYLEMFRDKATELETENESLKARLTQPDDTSSTEDIVSTVRVRVTLIRLLVHQGCWYIGLLVHQQETSILERCIVIETLRQQASSP